MAQHQQSAHVQVGLLLAQVRDDFLRVSPDDLEGPARALIALKSAFQLLNCDHCYSGPPQIAAAGEQRRRFDSTKGQEGRLLEESAGSIAGDGGGDVIADQGHEGSVRRMALRTAFLESSYLPFTSFLLREVGPTWLPAWDSAGGGVSPDLAATQGIVGSAFVEVVGSTAVIREEGGGAYNNTWSPPPRSMFEAFFRPPTVPPSLALLALCEGLCRQTPERMTAYRQTTLAQQSQSSLGSGVQAGLLVEATPIPDARAVQHICGLLEPYLLQPSSQQPQIPRHATGEPGPLLEQAVKELVDGIDNLDGTRIENIDKVERTAGEDRGGEKNDVAAGCGPSPLAGGDAAHALASVLCLVPQRVANSLGPIAPPEFLPTMFFPAVCRAVVRAILTLLSTSATTTTATTIAMTGVVWREFAGSLLTAGRASDLADAWLEAMMAVEGHEPVNCLDDGKTSPSEKGAGLADRETWAEGPDIVLEAHAWMITRLPASRRMHFTEALLRALWPRGGRGRHHTGWQRPHVQPGQWPTDFQTAACRTLIGRPLLPRKRLPRPPREGDGRPDIEDKNGGAETESSRASPQVREMQRHGDGLDDDDDESAVDVAVGLVERLLLQRPLPPPAAEAIADTLAWCDRLSSRSVGEAGAPPRVGAAGDGSGQDGERGASRGFLMGALKRVAAVWAEPSFLDKSPARQQQLYTRFLLAALRSGGLDGQLGGGADADPDALVLLIRGVSSHLDVPSRETRLRGMRVGEAVAALGGKELRFDELDGEREEQQPELRRYQGEVESKPRIMESGDDEDTEGRDSGKGVGEAAASEVREGGKETRGENNEGGGAGAVRERPRSNAKRRTRGSKGRRAALDTEERRNRHWQSLPASFGGGGGLGVGVGGRHEDDDDSDLDPDMLLPLGGAGSGSDSDDGDVVGGDNNNDTDGDEEEGASTCSSTTSSGEWDGRGGYGGSGFGLYDGEDDDDSLEAYDLRDDREDLAKVAEPVYLDQLIELLRSRDKPDTVDQHETALECAEKLVRRNPPDLANRAPELSRDLLYLEDSFDLERFEKLRCAALVATVAAAPEACAVYLGSEVWGTGATEGTKLLILDVLVQAASELAGWARPDGGEHASSSSGSYPSALLQEARGETPQGSVRRQQQRLQEQVVPSTTRRAAAATATSATTSPGTNPGALAVTAEDGATSDGASAATAAGGETQEDPGGGSTRGAGGKGTLSVGGTTRRWGYRRGPREQLRRNLFGRLAPVFFYPLAQGMVLRLRDSSTTAPSGHTRQRPLDAGATTGAAAAAAAIATAPYTLPSATPPPPPPSPLFSARLLHCLTCLVELCGNCPATPALAADLLGLAWLLRGAAASSRELRRAVLIAVATGVERAQDGAASGAVLGQQGEFLRWLQECARGPDGGARELAGAVLGHSSVQALAYI